MALNILAIGDPHFRASYIKVVDDFVQQTLELVIHKKPDAVVILGDILHDHEQARESCHSRAVHWFKELAKHTLTIVLIGNHDRPNNSHFLTDSHFFNGVKDHKNIIVVDKVRSIKFGKRGEFEGKTVENNYRVVCVPYVPPGMFQKALDTLEVSIEDDRPAIIFSHQEYLGAKMGAIVSTEGDVWPADGPLNISGHVHEYQVLANNLIYLGTPYQTSYSENTKKGVFFVGLSYGKEEGGKSSGTKDSSAQSPKNQKHQKPPVQLELKRIALNLRTKMSVNVTASEFPKFKLPEGNVDIRIQITGKQEAVEAIKYSALYKELRLMPNVKLCLIPTFDGDFKPSVQKKSYMEAFKSEISGNKALEGLFAEVFKGVQD